MKQNCHFWPILINLHFVSCVLKNLIWVLAFDATWLWLSFSASNGSQSWEETLQLLNLTAADNYLVWSILIAWLFCMSPVSPVIAFLIIWLWSWYWCSLALDFICRKQFGTIAITVVLLDSLKIMKTAWLQFCFDMKVDFYVPEELSTIVKGNLICWVVVANTGDQHNWSILIVRETCIRDNYNLTSLSQFSPNGLSWFIWFCTAIVCQTKCSLFWIV